MTTAASTLPELPTRQQKDADLQMLVTILEAQQRQKFDFVTKLGNLSYFNGNMALRDVPAQMDEQGVYDISGLYRPTHTADSQVAGLTGIPWRYMQKMRGGGRGAVEGVDHLDLLDHNVNYWIENGNDDKGNPLTDRKVLVRSLWGSDPEHPESSGVIRAVLSNKYGIRDNYDTVLAILDGMREAGLAADKIQGADITDDRLYLRIWAPEIYIKAPDLLRGHRDVRTGQTSREVGDIVFAGVKVTNSETGGGKQTVTPELVVLSCLNGMTRNKDSFGKVHLGSRLDEGAIEWSAATHHAANELTKNQIKDAVSAFMNRDYLQNAVDEITAKATEELDNPQEVIYEVVGKKLSYTEDEKTGILKHFIGGGQLTTGGILQAVTSFAHEVEDPARSNEIQDTGIEAMELAYAHMTRR